MSGGPKGAKRPLERPLDGRVRPRPGIAARRTDASRSARYRHDQARDCIARAWPSVLERSRHWQAGRAAHSRSGVPCLCCLPNGVHFWNRSRLTFGEQAAEGRTAQGIGSGGVHGMTFMLEIGGTQRVRTRGAAQGSLLRCSKALRPDNTQTDCAEHLGCSGV